MEMINIITTTDRDFLAEIDKRVSEAVERTYALCKGEVEAEAKAPITVEEIIEKYIKPVNGKTHKNTLLKRIRDRHIHTIKMNPVTIEVRDVHKVLAA